MQVKGEDWEDPEGRAGTSSGDTAQMQAPAEGRTSHYPERQVPRLRAARGDPVRGTHLSGEARAPVSGDFSDPENSGLPRTGYGCSHILSSFLGRTRCRCVAPPGTDLGTGQVERGVGSPPVSAGASPFLELERHAKALSTPALPIWGNEAGGRQGQRLG